MPVVTSLDKSPLHLIFTVNTLVSPLPALLRRMSTLDVHPGGAVPNASVAMAQQTTAGQGLPTDPLAMQWGGPWGGGGPYWAGVPGGVWPIPPAPVQISHPSQFGWQMLGQANVTPPTMGGWSFQHNLPQPSAVQAATGGANIAQPPLINAMGNTLTPAATQVVAVSQALPLINQHLCTFVQTGIYVNVQWCLRANLELISECQNLEEVKKNLEVVLEEPSWEVWGRAFAFYTAIMARVAPDALPLAAHGAVIARFRDINSNTWSEYDKCTRKAYNL